MAFTFAWLKGFFRRARTTLRWVQTENQLADSLTKDMDASWLVKILAAGRWCVSFKESIVRQPKSRVMASSKSRVM